MHADILFFLNSILLGVGLAMDAFSVSISNGIAEPGMKSGRRSLIAGTYALFQFAMPMIGWICVHTIIGYFTILEKFTPLVALVLLLYIGMKMITDAVREGKEKTQDADAKPAEDATTDTVPAAAVLTMRMLIIQGIATSIDALSVGVTFAEYPVLLALIAALLIGGVTYAICLIGLHIGRRVGAHFSEKAAIIGGCILIIIGIEIFIKGFL